MGEMADYLMDSFDDFDLDGDRIEEAGHITCSRCGEEDLCWESDSVGEGWHLINQEDERHVCHHATATDGFENEETT